MSTAAIYTSEQDAGARTSGLPWPVLLFIICVITPVWFNLGPLNLSVLRLYLLILTVPLMLQLLAGKYGRVLITDILFCLHVLWMAVALAVNNPDQVTLQVGSVGMEFLGGYAIGRAFIRTQADFLALCKVLVIVVLCLVPFTIYETLTGRPLIIEMVNKLPGVNHFSINTNPKRLNLNRVQGMLAHPIHFGLFCSVAFSLVFVALKGTLNGFYRWAAAIIIAASGFTALSSGALLAIILQIGLIVWAAVFARIAWRWWLLVGLFAVAWVVVDILSTRSPMRVFMSYATFSAHNAYWRATIFEWGLANVIGSVDKGIVGSPFFGIGMNNWIRPTYMNSGSMDNFWLVVAVRYGLPGLALLAIGLVYVVFHVMRRNFESSEKLTVIRRAWVFSMLGLSFTLSTVHIWTNIYSFIFFLFGAGVWLLFADTETDADSSVEERNKPLRQTVHTRFPNIQTRSLEQ